MQNSCACFHAWHLHLRILHLSMQRIRDVITTLHSLNLQVQALMHHLLARAPRICKTQRNFVSDGAQVVISASLLVIQYACMLENWHHRRAAFTNLLTSLGRLRHARNYAGRAFLYSSLSKFFPSSSC